ncbi:MAG: hypothetical protein F6J92_35970 [Symploca sp. SIO1A3]|nr:hypothetical protein [Symploca sp. SIO2C1]NER51949.1 hypothetical protein [Symploca sp. SIO1A3]
MSTKISSASSFYDIENWELGIGNWELGIVSPSFFVRSFPETIRPEVRSGKVIASEQPTKG